MKEFIKEIKDTYRQENKTLAEKDDYETSEDFYILQGWVEALEYVLKLAKDRGLDK